MHLQSSFQIRGAPAIASLAALSLRTHLSTKSFTTPAELSSHIKPILDHLQSSRPTAVNLSEALNRLRQILSEGEKSKDSGDEVKEKVREACKAVHGEDLARCMKMGKIGADWLWAKRGNGKKGLKVITVCNTGSLATSVSTC